MMLNAANKAQQGLDELRASLSNEEDAFPKVKYRQYLHEHYFRFDVYEALSFLPWARRRLAFWKGMAEAEYIHYTVRKGSNA